MVKCVRYTTRDHETVIGLNTLTHARTHLDGCALCAAVIQCLTFPSCASMMTTSPVSPEPFLAQLKALALKHEPPQQITIDVDLELVEYDHIHDYKILEQDLSRAAKRTLDNLERGRKYDKVLVLAIYWHKTLTDRSHLAVHAEKLLDVFHDKFGYQVDRHILESEDAYKILNKRLVSLDDQLGSKTEKNLLILYYGGHNGLNDDDSKARL
jgi:hypothetical protein